LGGNGLEGPLPAELGDLAALRVLKLAGNRFSGPLPAALGDLAALEDLSVQDNQFTGLLPAALGDLGALRYLNVGNNPLSGGIPHAYMNLSQLGDFLLYGTALCRPPDAAFAAWFETLFSSYEIASCATSLAGSDIDGAPGSVFALRGVVFPPHAPATVAVNGREVGQAMTDDYGEIAFLLDTTGAEEGRYDVTVEAGARAAFTIRLSEGRPPRAAEGEGETFAIPPGTAALMELFAPVVAVGP
ncbi:MAG: hypothetical protein KJ046_12635, partial [Anaerolineae bacterium]|nr:hypothetical protein [Anaerolineae bacterium]